MWWPLSDIDGTGPSIDTGDFDIELVMKDIETLNQEAEEGAYDITAISIAHYPSVSHLYDLTACGASLGDGYGPKIVAREDTTIELLLECGTCFAVPGLRTSALAALRILARECDISWRAIPFTEIMTEVSNGNFQAGVVIHEGQLTYEQYGLFEVCDLGRWWYEKTGLPLPLGGNSIKRDFDQRFGIGATSKVTSILVRSIEFALANREKSLDWAMQWGRGIDFDCTDEFVEMYVNKWTLDFGESGKKAVKKFLSEASKVGAVQAVDTVAFV